MSAFLGKAEKRSCTNIGIPLRKLEVRSSRVGVGAQKIHYWVQQGWINYRRTPSGKHFIVWADAEDLRRLKKIATKTNSWTAARHPDLVIPKKRSVR